MERQENQEEYLETLKKRLRRALIRLRKLQKKNKELGIKISTKKAWLEVAEWQEEVGKLIPADTSEGKKARLKTIRAAWKARDILLAQKLFESYLIKGELRLADFTPNQMDLLYKPSESPEE